MQALNKKEVQKKSVNFWLQFCILIFSMLFVVYFYVWSSSMENKKYMEQLQEYKNIENTQIVLGYKTDSLYWYIQKLTPQTNTDEKFLVSYIREKKEEVLKISSADSTPNFSIYQKIAGRLDEQLGVRDSIILVEKSNSDLKRNLDECMKRNGELRKMLGSR